jgi:hypothetical protein
MKFRPRHLACLILLLSSLSGAEGSLLHSGDFTLGGHYIAALLAQDHAGIRSEAVLEPHARDLSHLDLPVALVGQHRPAWTLRPPSAHSMQLQAVTSFAA